MVFNVDKYELGRIRKALDACWSWETSYHGKEEYEARALKGIRSFGQCYVTARVVKEICGGDIVKNGNVKHYWNRLPDGMEIDLTSDQFDGDGIYPVMGENDDRETFEKYIGKTRNPAGGQKRFAKLLRCVRSSLETQNR